MSGKLGLGGVVDQQSPVEVAEISGTGTEGFQEAPWAAEESSGGPEGLHKAASWQGLVEAAEEVVGSCKLGSDRSAVQ
jgi:hypothetical protein